MSEHLEIYKIVVDTVTANEGRRQRSATAYLGMLAAIATAAAAIPGLPLIAPAFVSLILALTWLATVWYFRRLAQAKFSVINKIEGDLAFPVFQLEQEHLKSARCFFKFDLTHLEMIVPIVVIILSVGYISYWSYCYIFSLFS